MQMRKSNIFAVLVLFTLTLALGCSALAAPGSLTYRKAYDLDGIIMMKIQAGSDYNNTGQHKTLVQGVGSLTRYELVRLGEDGLEALSDNYWVADPDSLRGLEVSSTFKLHNLDGEELFAGDVDDQHPPQIFAVSIQADPGEEGSLGQDISAAAAVYGEEDAAFSISQTASTAQGTVKRYIDLVEPVSGEYLFEDSVIVGRVNISELLKSADDFTDYLTLEGSVPGAENDLYEFTAEDVNHDADGTEEGPEPVEGADQDLSIIIDGSEVFKSTVPPGTKLEDIGLHEKLTFSLDNILIRDIYVEWDDRLFSNYEPDVEGSYTFEGQLIFPETIETGYEVYIYHVVNVVDPAENETGDEEEQ